MAEKTQGVSSGWNERMRMIRLRRKKERLRFWTEFKLVPRWLMATLGVLYVIALVTTITVNLSFRNNPNGNEMFPWELRNNPALASLAMAGVVTGVSIVFSAMLFMLGYVYRDAKRRDMNPALWTLLVTILLPAWGVIGLIIYLLVREPLPYPCPNCQTLVGPRFNFCPACKTDLHPSCPNCKREIVETDKFCPYCATDLKNVARETNAITAPE